MEVKQFFVQVYHLLMISITFILQLELQVKWKMLFSQTNLTTKQIIELITRALLPNCGNSRAISSTVSLVLQEQVELSQESHHTLKK